MGRRTSTSSTTGSTHVNTTLTPPSPLAWALHPSAPTRPHVRRMACRMSLADPGGDWDQDRISTWPNSTVNSIRAPSTYPNPRRLQPQPRRSATVPTPTPAGSSDDDQPASGPAIDDAWLGTFSQLVVTDLIEGSGDQAVVGSSLSVQYVGVLASRRHRVR